MDLPPPLRSALIDVAGIMAPAQHDWWIITSAALALHGVDPGPVRDIDVLFDPRDAGAVLGPLELEPRVGAGDGRFRSDLFVTWSGSVLPVEMFAGFTVFENERWMPVTFESRQAIDLDGARLWVPSREDLHTLLRRFGRKKDLDRAARISPSGQFPSRSGSA